MRKSWGQGEERGRRTLLSFTCLYIAIHGGDEWSRRGGRRGSEGGGGEEARWLNKNGEDGKTLVIVGAERRFSNMLREKEFAGGGEGCEREEGELVWGKVGCCHSCKICRMQPEISK